MDGNDIAMILQTVGPLVAAGMSANAGSEDRELARRILQQMMAKYGKLSTPQLDELPPELLGDTALAGLETDPKLREHEMGALDSLSEMADSGGLTIADRAALNRVQNQTARRESAGRAAIANDFAARGQLGSGAQLAMSLANQQDSANRASDAAMDTAGNAQRRYYDAVLKRGQMAGQMSDRDYARKADAARARDMIAKHNAAARTDAGRYRNDVRSQRFSNDMSLAGAQSGAGYRQANYLQNEASRQAEQTGRAWDAGIRGASSLFEDEERKKRSRGY